MAGAELCQLSGWMWFDGGDAGMAQRAFLLGIRMAGAARDDVLATALTTSGSGRSRECTCGRPTGGGGSAGGSSSDSKCTAGRSA